MTSGKKIAASLPETLTTCFAKSGVHDHIRGRPVPEKASLPGLGYVRNAVAVAARMPAQTALPIRYARPTRMVNDRARE
jgi:hypothetical protein